MSIRGLEFFLFFVLAIFCCSVVIIFFTDSIYFIAEMRPLPKLDNSIIDLYKGYVSNVFSCYKIASHRNILYMIRAMLIYVPLLSLTYIDFS
jgi:hypothetical protein